MFLIKTNLMFIGLSFDKIFLMTTKIFIKYGKFFLSNFTIEHAETVKNPCFFPGFSGYLIICVLSSIFFNVFCLNCKIIGFSRIPSFFLQSCYMCKTNQHNRQNCSAIDYPPINFVEKLIYTNFNQ